MNKAQWLINFFYAIKIIYRTSVCFAEVSFAESDKTLKEYDYFLMLAGDDQTDKGDLCSEEISGEYLYVFGCVD